MSSNPTVYINVDESFGVDKSLRKFKRKCETYGIVREYRKREEYRKPSVTKKEKLEAAEKRRKKTSFKSRSSRI